MKNLILVLSVSLVVACGKSGSSDNYSATTRSCDQTFKMQDGQSIAIHYVATFGGNPSVVATCSATSDTLNVGCNPDSLLTAYATDSLGNVNFFGFTVSNCR